MDAKGANCTTIFLADDDATVRQTLNDFFAKCPNYQVIGTASNGMDAVERCKQLRPDVALLDIQMPLLDGIAAARLILENKYTKCVVMLTAFSDRAYIQDTLDAGAFGYLTKPFEPEKILPTLELCIHQSREFHLLRKELKNLERRAEERPAVDQAKLMLMEIRGMSEDEAYQYIRELSRRKGMSMMKVAQYIIAKLESSQ